MNTTETAPLRDHRDYEGAKLGMWLFLFTEILLFGGLFILYSAYRSQYPLEFHSGGRHLNVVLGVANTFILLTSSLTMAIAITAIRKNDRRLSLLCLASTIILGAAFLVNKYFEWSTEIHHGLYPNSPLLVDQPEGDQIFFGLYYSMTGLHGLHVLAEHFVLARTEKMFGSGEGLRLTALSLRYPAGIMDNLSAFVYYDWENDQFFRFASWQRTYDRWQFFLIGFWNPEDSSFYQTEQGNGLFAGVGFQIMVVFNH